jgi:hypothetical protein
MRMTSQVNIDMLPYRQKKVVSVLRNMPLYKPVFHSPTMHSLLSLRGYCFVLDGRLQEIGFISKEHEFLSESISLGQL